MFKNGMLRRIPGSKRGNAWRKLHNQELHKLYSPPNIIRMIKSRRMRLAEHVTRMKEKINGYRVMVEKRERKIPQGRHRNR
jgi:hypothetical protein